MQKTSAYAAQNSCFEAIVGGERLPRKGVCNKTLEVQNAKKEQPKKGKNDNRGIRTHEPEGLAP